MGNDETSAKESEINLLAIDKKGIEQVRSILNMLTESTFFYPEDDPDLFFFLRRNQSGFREFFEHYFGWRLHVDQHVARLLKERQYNEKLRPAQRFLFDLRRRDECLLFTLLLEFHEEEAQRQGIGPDDHRHLRFLYADFIIHAIRRCKEELGEICPTEAKIHEAAKPLFDQLEKYRFIQLVDKSLAEAGENLPAGMNEHLLYEFLAGIRCYDASQAGHSVVIEAYKAEKDEDNPLKKSDSNSTQESIKP